MLEGLVVREAHEGVIILLHAFCEEVLEQSSENQVELLSRIDRGRLSNTLIIHGRLHNRIEEELVCLIEVGAESLIQGVDDL